MAKIKTYSIEAKADDQYGVAVKAGARTLHVDQPLFVGGADAGATPLEHLFAALAGCLAATARIIAKQKNMVLNGMDIQIDGSLDLDVLAGRITGRPGLLGIDVQVTLDSGMSPLEQQSFLQELRLRCPVADTITAATPLTMVAG